MSDLEKRNTEAMLSTLTTLRGELSTLAADNTRTQTALQQLVQEVQGLRESVVALSVGNRGSGPTT